LGQIEDASFRFAGPTFAGTPVPVSTALCAVAELDELTVECGVELSVDLMSGVVAQIQPRENMNVLGHECESGCAPGPSRQTHAEVLV
jgi:hypothetical protein